MYGPAVVVLQSLRLKPRRLRRSHLLQSTQTLNLQNIRQNPNILDKNQTYSTRVATNVYLTYNI